MLVRSWFHRLSRVLLPETWRIRADQRGVNRYYREQNKYNSDDHIYELFDLHEQLQAVETRRVLRLASRYFIIVLDTPRSSDNDESEYWEWSSVNHRWYLKPAGVASLQRQIQEAKKQRREVWEAWAKIVGGLMTGLVALVSALVSLILAWGR
jgi:hypothetical protein